MVLRPQTIDPTTSATQVAIYNKLVTYGAAQIPNLFYRPNSNQTPIQMTYPSISTGLDNGTPPKYLIQQYSFVAGPFIIYGGLISAPTNGKVVTLTPGTNLLYVDIICANVVPQAGIVIAVAIPTNVTGTSFTISFSSTLKFDIYYLAIGQ